MTKEKKIALLNMRYDNNYGGNLQRYAIVRVLQAMGYEVEYLYIRHNWDDWFRSRSKFKVVKRCIKQCIKHILYPSKEPWLPWQCEARQYVDLCKITEPFLDRYVPHTRPVYLHRQLERVFRRGKYDVVLAGSDQIWCKHHIERYGLGMWFLDFVPNTFNGKRVVYGASFGVDGKEYTTEDLQTLLPLYGKLDAVSVRENSGLKLLESYGMTLPNATQVVDPVLLLDKYDWEMLIDKGTTQSPKAEMICYMLYVDDEKQKIIDEIAEQNGYKYEFMDISINNRLSVEQWLRNIHDAKYVVTDSYHGFLFSLLFNKPYRLLQMGKNGGNTRFESVFNMLGISNKGENVNWDNVNAKIKRERVKSMEFLNQSL